MIELIPSLTYPDTAAIQQRFAVKPPSARKYHLDVADGRFVSNSLVSTQEVVQLDWPCPFECHLMVHDAVSWAEPLLELPECETMVVHLEAEGCTLDLLQHIRQHDRLAGLAVKPATPVAALEQFIDEIDAVTVMTVEPGSYGGQFLPETLEKVSLIRQRWPAIKVEVDGGVNPATLPAVLASGAHHAVVGSFLSNGDEQQRWQQLQEIIQAG